METEVSGNGPKLYMLFSDDVTKMINIWWEKNRGLKGGKVTFIKGYR
jgi:hypothetical protein